MSQTSIMDSITELQNQINELTEQVSTLSNKLLSRYGELVVIEDFDAQVQSGRFIFYSTTLNNPRNAQGVLEVFVNYDNEAEINQLAVYTDDENVFAGVRHSTNSGTTWSDWHFSPTVDSTELLWMGSNKIVTNQAPVNSMGKNGDFWIKTT